MDWITPHIAIGNYLDARGGPPEITAILCLKPGCPCEERDDIPVLAIPLVDGPGNPALSVEDAVDFIADMVEDGERLLVHCHAGRSRSVAIVARHLMLAGNLTASEALAAISARREIWLTPGIESILTGKAPR